MELSRLGRYDLVRRIARGGNADVYLGVAGTDTVAVKVLDPARAADPEAPALFGAEARLGALLSHPAVPAVYEAASEHGVHFIAMEYVDGVELGELLARGPVPLPAALSIVAAAAAGLDHAHRRCGADGRPLRLVHRDVSPSNIMVTHDGAVKVIDFGIAQTEATARDGLVRGKPSYMSPEQCRGEPIDLRADVFALGIVLYELTTGRPCFVGARGNVTKYVWDQARQQGYMRFVGLHPNDPKQYQYQLWIFDKDRDAAFPVDGGVFDVSSTGEIVVPISPKLHVGDATLFAVTVERPGGVVVSKRERIVVTAARG